MVCGRPRIEDLVSLPLCWCRDCLALRDIRGGVGLLEHDLIATRLAIVIRLSRRASWSRQNYCCGVFLGRDRVAVATPCPVATRSVAVPFPIVMVSRRPWGSRQYLLTEGDTFVAVSWTPVLVSLLRVAQGYERARTRASGGFCFGVLLVSWSRSWVPIRSGTGVCSFPTSRYVRGPGWFCLWAFDLVEALFARLTPLLPSARGSSSRELGVGRVAEAAGMPLKDCTFLLIPCCPVAADEVPTAGQGTGTGVAAACTELADAAAGLAPWGNPSRSGSSCRYYPSLRKRKSRYRGFRRATGKART
ncbi:hypothetical protein Taro_050309 [Colocasia esculenta]|uniref:Uncharacterized protein n=1 Tax=Colocasia esculenta TaxID=4460 RepID=A0A843XDL2_COLES|nr:hypothetical protein [Colocasia esculenta]